MVCVVLRLLFLSVQVNHCSDIYNNDRQRSLRQRCRRLRYLVLDGVRATRAGDVWENVRPSRWRAVPANVACERRRETARLSPHQLRTSLHKSVRLKNKKSRLCSLQTKPEHKADMKEKIQVFSTFLALRNIRHSMCCIGSFYVEETISPRGPFSSCSGAVSCFTRSSSAVCLPWNWYPGEIYSSIKKTSKYNLYLCRTFQSNVERLLQKMMIKTVKSLKGTFFSVPKRSLL